MSHCFILDANVIVKNDMIIDFDQQLLYYQNSQEELFYPTDSKKGCNIAYIFESITTNSKVDSSSEIIPEVKYVPT